MSSILAYVLSVSALPWVGWAMLQVAQRGRLRDAGLLGLVWGTVFLSGDAIGFALCGALLAPVALWVAPRVRTVAGLALGAGVATLLSCVELLPSTRVAAEAVRLVGVPSPTIGLHWALHPWRLPELVLPGYLGVRSRMVSDLFHDGTAVFATTVFAGGVVLVLAAAGLITRRRLAWAFGAVALVGLWLALDDRGGLYALARQTWLFARFRYPERYLAFFWLGLVPVVALGADVAVAQTRRWSKVLLAVAGVFCALAAAVVTFGAAPRVWALAGAPLDAEDPLAALLDNGWCSGLLWTAGFALLAWAALRLGGVRRSGLLLAGVVFLELWHGNGGHLPLVPPGLITAPTAFSSALHAVERAAEPPARVFHSFEPEYPSSVTGPAEERERWVRGMRHVLGWDVAGLEHIPSLHVNLGATSVRHTLLPWEGGPALARAAGTVRWLPAEPEYLALDVVAEAPTALVVTDEYAEGWTARVDGQPVPIHPTLLAVRGVEVPAGPHRVEFFYRTRRFTAGLSLSLLGLLVGLALIAGGGRRP